MDETNVISLLEKFKSLQLSKNIDFDKFNRYAITHHSTTIEGSTLTEIETQILLDDGTTPRGKPLLHSLMVQDHYRALLFIIEAANKKKPLTPEFIQQANSAVMKQTGNIYNTVFGELDSAKGVFRKGNVTAGNSYFVGYDKVAGLVKKLCVKVNEKLTETQVTEQVNISFDAHFDLVTIHPFYDGNGRTSRLLMNYRLVFFSYQCALFLKKIKQNILNLLYKPGRRKTLLFLENLCIANT